MKSERVPWLIVVVALLDLLLLLAWLWTAGMEEGCNSGVQTGIVCGDIWQAFEPFLGPAVGALLLLLVCLLYAELVRAVWRSGDS